MPSRIDYLGISVPYRMMFQRDFSTGELIAGHGLLQQLPHLMEHVMSYRDMKEGKGNRIFDRSVYSAQGGFSAFWRNTLAYSKIDFTGTGCDELYRTGMMKKFIPLYGQWLTRLDIATDIETTSSPFEFVESGFGARWKVSEAHDKETGQTVYVGSRDSERYARVYRYHDPHPRSHLLRVEVVLKGQFAKDTAALLRSSRLSSIVSALGNTFGWKSSLWTERAIDSKLKAPVRKGGKASRERWLFSQVLPAIEKMIVEEDSDYVELFYDRIRTLLGKQETERYFKNDRHPLQDRTNDNLLHPAEDMFAGG